jgi:broad specificity phosphatase PhoE
MRHGYSCANLAKRLGFFKTGYLHNQYTDPELTATGIKYAKDIYNKYHKGTGLNTDQFPLLSLLYQQGIQNVCSSVLMRTQQTAQYTFDPEKITVIPYVSEEGGFEENTPIRDQSVKKNIMYQSDLYTGDPMQNTYSKLDYSLIQGISDANIPDVHKFLRWLNENYQKIRINPDVNTIIIVSHKHFMQSLHQYITGKKININNYDMLQYELELSGDRHRKIIYSPDSFTGKIFEYPNTKFIKNADRNNADDICRRKTRGRRNRNTYTHTFKYNPKSLNKKRYGRNYRANNIKKYRNNIYENRPEFYHDPYYKPVSNNTISRITGINKSIITSKTSKKISNNYTRRGYTRKSPVLQTGSPTRSWANWWYGRSPTQTQVPASIPTQVPASTPAPAPAPANMSYYTE